MGKWENGKMRKMYKMIELLNGQVVKVLNG